MGNAFNSDNNSIKCPPKNIYKSPSNDDNNTSDNDILDIDKITFDPTPEVHTQTVTISQKTYPWRSPHHVPPFPNEHYSDFKLPYDIICKYNKTKTFYNFMGEIIGLKGINIINITEKYNMCYIWHNRNNNTIQIWGHKVHHTAIHNYFTNVINTKLNINMDTIIIKQKTFNILKNYTYKQKYKNQLYSLSKIILNTYKLSQYKYKLNEFKYNFKHTINTYSMKHKEQLAEQLFINTILYLRQNKYSEALLLFKNLQQNKIFNDDIKTLKTYYFQIKLGNQKKNKDLYLIQTLAGLYFMPKYICNNFYENPKKAYKLEQFQYIKYLD